MAEARTTEEPPDLLQARAELDSLQEAFARAMRGGPMDPDLLARIEGAGLDPAERLRIHQRHYVNSLTDVLLTGFPACHRAVGRRIFPIMARGFIEASPPEVPMLARWGDRFPAFLAGIVLPEPCPWLADLAALEWARIEASFAAPAEPMAPDALLQVPPEHLAGLRLLALPSARIVLSPWPLFRLWSGLSDGAEPGDLPYAPPLPDEAPAEAVALCRISRGLRQRAFDPAAATLLADLLAGQALGEALQAAAEREDMPRDLQGVLAGALSLGLFRDLALS